MTPYEFITKWRASALTERSASHQHFLDLCDLLGEPKPADADPSGESYCFERGARKDSGGDGWADVWKRHHFAWEYKGKRANLDAAFEQLRQYALALENPPLLIVSDMLRFRIRTNWTNSVSRTHSFAAAGSDSRRSSGSTAGCSTTAPYCRWSSQTSTRCWRRRTSTGRRSTRRSSARCSSAGSTPAAGGQVDR